MTYHHHIVEDGRDEVVRDECEVSGEEGIKGTDGDGSGDLRRGGKRVVG